MQYSQQIIVKRWLPILEGHVSPLDAQFKSPLFPLVSRFLVGTRPNGLAGRGAHPTLLPTASPSTPILLPVLQDHILLVPV